MLAAPCELENGQLPSGMCRKINLTEPSGNLRGLRGYRSVLPALRARVRDRQQLGHQGRFHQGQQQRML